MARRKLLGDGVHVSAKQVRELMKLAVRDEELSDRRWDMRLLPDGRVLWYLGNTMAGTVYPSREAFAKMRQELEAEAAKGPVDLTRTLLPPIADFLRDPEALAKGLGKAIGVPDEALDRSVDSIDIAYKAFLRMRAPKRETPEVVGPLTAYVGEVMRRACDGQWTSVPTRGHENEPMIRARDGALLQPFALVLVEMTEHGSRGSLTGAVSGTLARYLVEKRKAG
jgi:hypothetical protein